PRLRRLTYWPPASVFEVSEPERLNDGAPADDRLFRTSPTVTRPDFAICSAFMIWIGWAVSRSTWRIREPVTSTRCRFCCCEASCATAAVMPRVMPPRQIARTDLDKSVSIMLQTPRGENAAAPWEGHCH